MRTHASGITLRPGAEALATRDEAPVILEPRPGARWLIDPSNPPVLTLRARLGDALAQGLRWELDGRPLA